MGRNHIIKPTGTQGEKQMSENKIRAEEKIEVMVVSGVEGYSIYIDNYRIAGSKPWGGGKEVCKYLRTKQQILDALCINHDPEETRKEERERILVKIEDIKKERITEVDGIKQPIQPYKYNMQTLEQLKSYLNGERRMDFLILCKGCEHCSGRKCLIGISACPQAVLCSYYKKIDQGNTYK